MDPLQSEPMAPFQPPKSEHLHILRKHFKQSCFRPVEWEIICEILENRRDGFVTVPSGNGTSLCFQFPPVFSNGTALFITPSVSLMEEQVHALKAGHISACRLEEDNILNVLNGLYRLVYGTPEFCISDRGQRFLSQLAKTNIITLVAIDQAHCISQLSQNYNPSYRQLSVISRIVGSSVPIVAVTSTAFSSEIQSDVCSIFLLRKPFRISLGFDRPNLYLAVHAKGPNITEDLQLLMPNQIASEEGFGVPTIVYSPKQMIEGVVKAFQDRGVQCQCYHTDMNLETRNEVLDSFLKNSISVLVCSIACGLEVNKPDVRLVIHIGAPWDLESYYQEVCSAGRDGEPSQCHCYYSMVDLFLNKVVCCNLTGKAYEDRERATEQVQEYLETKECRRKILINHFKHMNIKNLETPAESCCDNCRQRHVEREMKGKYDFTEDATLLLKAIEYFGGVGGIDKVIQFLKGKKDKKLQTKDCLHELYGKGSHQQRDWWRMLGSMLLEEGYLTKEPRRRNAIELTTVGVNYLQKSSLSPDTTKLCLNPSEAIKMKWKISESQSSPNVSSSICSPTELAESLTTTIQLPAFNLQNQWEQVRQKPEAACGKPTSTEIFASTLLEDPTPLEETSAVSIGNKTEKEILVRENSRIIQHHSMTNEVTSRVSSLQVADHQKSQTRYQLAKDKKPNIGHNEEVNFYEKHSSSNHPDPDLIFVHECPRKGILSGVTYSVSYDLFQNQGMSIEQISKKLDLKEDVIAAHLAKAVRSGLPLDVTRMGITEEMQEDILRAVKSVDLVIAHVTPIKKRCPNYITMEQLYVGLAILMHKYGTKGYKLKDGTYNKGPTTTDQVPQRKTKLKRQPYSVSYNLYQKERMTIEETAKKQKLNESTVGSHLAEAVEAGLPLDAERMGITAEVKANILKAVQAVDLDILQLTPIKQNCPSHITWEQLKIGLAILVREFGVENCKLKAPSSQMRPNDDEHPPDKAKDDLRERGNQIVSNLCDTVRTSYELYQIKGCTLEDIAKQRTLKASKIASHLADAVKAGFPLDTERMGLTAESEALILKAVRAVGSCVSRLTPIKQKCPHHITWEQLKVGLALLTYRYGVQGFKLCKKEQNDDNALESAGESNSDDALELNETPTVLRDTRCWKQEVRRLSFVVSYELYQNLGLTLKEIAEKRHIKEFAVASHLANAVTAGLPLDVIRMGLTGEVQEVMLKAIREVDSDISNLAPIKEHCPNYITWAKLKLGVALLARKYGVHCNRGRLFICYNADYLETNDSPNYDGHSEAIAVINDIPTVCHSSRKALDKLGMYEAYELYQKEQLAIEQIAKKWKERKCTIENHLAKAVKMGLPLDSDRLGLSKEVKEVILNVIRATNSDISFLTPIKQQCPHFVTWEQLDICVSLLSREHGVQILKGKIMLCDGNDVNKEVMNKPNKKFENNSPRWEPNAVDETLKNLSYTLTYQLYQNLGLTVKETACKRKLKESTVATHLAESLKAGLPLDVLRLGMTYDIKESVLQAIRSVDSDISRDRLIKEKCLHITWVQLRVGIALLIQEYGVQGTKLGKTKRYHSINSEGIVLERIEQPSDGDNPDVTSAIISHQCEVKLNKLDYAVSYHLYQNKGMTLEQAAKEQNLETAAVGLHLAKAVEAGLFLDVERMGITEEIKQIVLKAIRVVNPDSSCSEHIRKLCPNYITQEQLTVTVALLASKSGAECCGGINSAFKRAIPRRPNEVTKKLRSNTTIKI